MALLKGIRRTVLSTIPAMMLSERRCVSHGPLPHISLLMLHLAPSSPFAAAVLRYLSVPFLLHGHLVYGTTPARFRSFVFVFLVPDLSEACAARGPQPRLVAAIRTRSRSLGAFGFTVVAFVCIGVLLRSPIWRSSRLTTSSIDGDLGMQIATAGAAEFGVVSALVMGVSWGLLAVLWVSDYRPMGKRISPSLSATMTTSWVKIDVT